jgi:hypothetical protein
MHMAATNQLKNKVALVAGTRLVNFQASAATLLSADLVRTQTELPGKLGRASAIYINKISMNSTGKAQPFVLTQLSSFGCVSVLVSQLVPFGHS